MASGKVISVDRVSTKGGSDAWQIVTDYAVRDADGLCRCAMWIPESAPVPPIGTAVTWGPHHVQWGVMIARKLENSFDPNDPALYTG